MKTRVISKRTAAVGLAAALAVVGITWAQPGPPAGRGGTGPMMESPSSRPRMMHQNHQQMMEKMQAKDEKLLEQVENLTSATPEAKIDLLVSIVTTLVQDRAEMHSQMRMMNPPMDPDQMMQAEKMQSIAGQTEDSDKTTGPATDHKDHH